MSTRLFASPLLGFGASIMLGACADPELASSCHITPDGSIEQRNAELALCMSSTSADVVDTRLRRDVDILFLIDNSASMSPKQKVLAQAIPAFMQKIDDTGANYHVGIVTSDVGSLPQGGAGTDFSDPRCNTLAGDDGRLQAKPCTTRTTTGATGEFISACQSLCPDPSFIPKDGQLFISKENGVINVPSAKDVMGHELGPQRAFQCMALVGELGCSVESQLESVKRALDGHLAENSGFLRSDSVLAVIFITDEDDCSVQLSQRAKSGQFSVSCDPNSPDPASDCFSRDFRCLARSITCDQSLATPGNKTGCVERPNNFLEPLANYVNFFTRQRTADKLVLAGIWAPSLLDYQAGISTQGKLVVAPESSTNSATNGLNRGQKENAACYNDDASLTADSRGFFGQAELRLSSFVRKFDKSVPVERSICDTKNYPLALDAIANNILTKTKPYCLSSRPSVVNDTPICLVGFVDASESTALPDSYLPQCGTGCCNAWADSTQPISEKGRDPAIVSACTAEAADCFCAVPSRKGACDEGAVAGIWRQGNLEVPTGKIASFRCATAHSTVAR